jgi:hypothetical protein
VPFEVMLIGMFASVPSAARVVPVSVTPAAATPVSKVGTTAVPVKVGLAIVAFAFIWVIVSL